MNRNIHAFLYLIRVCLFPQDLKNPQMSFEKTPNLAKNKMFLLKSSKINKWWFLWQFLRQIVSFDPKVHYLWILWLSDHCVRYHNILNLKKKSQKNSKNNLPFFAIFCHFFFSNSKYCDIVPNGPKIIKFADSVL